MHLTIDIQEVDDAIRVTIADNGIGMTKEKDQRHIFEQFYQVEHSHVQRKRFRALRLLKQS